MVERCDGGAMVGGQIQLFQGTTIVRIHSNIRTMYSDNEGYIAKQNNTITTNFSNCRCHTLVQNFLIHEMGRASQKRWRNDGVQAR